MAQFLKGDDAWLYVAPLIPLVALAVNVAAQILLVRATRGVNFLRTLIGGSLVGCLALLALDAMFCNWLAPVPDGLIVSLLVHVPTYAALTYAYSFGVANLGQTSIRIRIYSEIAGSPTGKSTGEIEELYGEGAFTKMRVSRLVESGDIVERDGRYYTGRSRLVVAAHIIFGLKRFLLGQHSEFQ